MDKLYVFFVIALFTIGAFVQGQNQFPGQNPNARPNGRPTARPTPRPNVRPDTTSTEPTTAGTTTQSPAQRECVRLCPVTTEYNPVCGTDLVTYTNPGRLSCAQFCGVSVTLLRTSPCPTPPPVDPL